MDPIPPTAPFPRLPEIAGKAGAGRQVGVEIEFGALDLERAARLVAGTFGGDAKPISAAEWHVEDSEIGSVKVVLDTALRPSSNALAAEAGVALARQVVPVEIVTAPVPQEKLHRVERLCRGLRLAGAEGSRSHLVHGFGLHLNIALADPDTGSDMPRIVRAFALLEPWLRKRDPLDLARRVLPYAAYPGSRRYRTILSRKLVRAVPGTMLARLTRREEMRVNALHSQAVDRLGEGLRVAAHDEGGMIQAIERVDAPLCLGIQWHPEHLFYHATQRRLFAALVAAAGERAAA